jgi:hypothetical protein
MYPLLDAVDESLDTLLMLVPEERMRDAYVLSRVVYETALNACYILASGDEMAHRAWGHSKQKAVRDLCRDFWVADKRMTLGWSGQNAPSTGSSNTYRSVNRWPR